MVTILMEKGADPSKEDEEGMTPLDVAVMKCAHQDVIQKLLGGGCAKTISEGKLRGTTEERPKSREYYDWIFSRNKEH